MCTRSFGSQSNKVHPKHQVWHDRPGRLILFAEDVKSLGGKPVLQSIEEASVDDMVKTIQDTKASTVVWAAGAGAGNADRTKAVDQEGAIRSMDATSKAGVKRYIIVSAVDVRDRENKPEPEWYHDGDRERSNKTWDAIGVCRMRSDECWSDFADTHT